MSAIDRVRAICEPIAADLDVDLFDLEHTGGILRVTLDRDGGLDMEVIAEATRRISRALDEHDPIAGRYTLEVSSPGLERALRTPDHWRWAIGRDVTVKLRPGVEGDRRLRAVVRSADDDGVTLGVAEPTASDRYLTYDEIDKARTVFEWGPAPKPGGKGGSSRRAAGGTTSQAEVETT